MLEIRKTMPEDIPTVTELFDKARKTMALLKIDQWQDGYPFEEDIRRDIENGESYVLTSDGKTIGTFMMTFGKEPTYKEIFGGSWIKGDEVPYITIHRITVDPSFRKSGSENVSASKFIIDFAKGKAIDNEISGGIKIDTHKGNIPMRKMLSKNGFEYCGTIFLLNGDERVAYQWVQR